MLLNKNYGLLCKYTIDVVAFTDNHLVPKICKYLFF